MVSERPGVTTRELAAASGVQGGTLSSLLRTLTQRGELEKRALPGGRTGYAIAQSATPNEQAAAQPTDSSPASRQAGSAAQAAQAPTTAAPADYDADSIETNPDSPATAAAEQPSSRSSQT